MPSLNLETLRIDVADSKAGSVRIDWRGRSESRDPTKALSGFFTPIFEQAARTHALVEMHFEKLEYLNSSTIAAVIRIIHLAQDKAVGLTISYDASLKWQTLSFDGLKRALKPFEGSSGGTVQFIGVQGS